MNINTFDNLPPSMMIFGESVAPSQTNKCKAYTSFGATSMVDWIYSSALRSLASFAFNIR